MRAFWRLLARDLRLALRQRSDGATVVLFFVLTAALFPFALGSDQAFLTRVAPGILWVTALLAVLLSLERLFLADFEDGSLDQMLLSPLALELAVLAKAAAHWLTTGLLLVIATPLLALLYSLPAEATLSLLAALLLGTPALSLIGAIGAALTLGTRRGGVLVPLLVQPLYVPSLIFGVAASEAALSGASPMDPLLLLGAIFLVMLLVAPLGGAAALRQAAE